MRLQYERHLRRYGKSNSYCIFVIGKNNNALNVFCLKIIFKDQYFTIHITPELEFSYVSFETNVSNVRYYDLINRVVDTFKPGKFLVTICANDVSIVKKNKQKLEFLCFIFGYFSKIIISFWIFFK